MKKAILGDISGFRVHQSNRVAGDNTTGYWVIANHKSWCTKAEAFTKSRIEEDIPGEFATAYKGIVEYGAKVIDERRKCATALFCRI